MADVPTERDAVILEPSMLCEEHIEEAQAWDLSFFAVMQATQGACMESEQFYEIAFWLKNGYGPPEGDIPENEQPGIQHINDTLDEIEPVCCWLAEHVDNPFPDDPPSAYLGIIAEYAAREMPYGGAAE